MASPRESLHALIVCAAAALVGSSAPAHAGGCYVILPSTLELCTNGARFMVREFDACGAGATMHAGFWNQATTTILYSSSHTFGAQGDVYRYELSYPTAGYVAGNMVALTVSDNPAEQSGSLGTTIEVPIEDCRLLDPIETANVWNLTGTAGLLTGTTFDYDGDGIANDPFGLGSFRLVSTHRSTAPVDSGVDFDSSGANEFDVASISQSFAPLDPCYLTMTLGFYSNEPSATGDDDLAWLDLGFGYVGYNLPYLASNSGFLEWPFEFDALPRSAPAVGGALGEVGYSQGGSLVNFSLLDTIGGGGQNLALSFKVADEETGDFASALLVDSARCDTSLIFAAGFEVGFLEWDAAVGAP